MSFNDSFTCEDVDECDTGIHLCDENASCDDFDGGYNCTCNMGWFGDGWECVDSDECANAAPGVHNNVTDSDWWGTHNCNETAFCENVPGSWNCTCSDGYYGDGVECIDSNECGIDENVNATAGVSSTGIEDGNFGINECGTNTTCTNVIGDYNCTCPDGYDGDGRGEEGCVDVNECRDGTDDCHEDARCKNTIGSYLCTCDDGFFGDGANCTDSDECGFNPTAPIWAGDTDDLWNTHTCDSNAECINEIGAYNCSCLDGFVGDGFANQTADEPLGCTDFDECKEGTHGCSEDAECQNIPGSYNCICEDGFFGDGVTCKDIDECGDEAQELVVAENGTDIYDPGYGLHNCADDAECFNQIGYYNCSCLPGFFGNGEECHNIDECDEDVDECSDNADCDDTIGSYTCTCHDGWFGDGFECLDSDECAESAIQVHNVTADPLYNSTECSVNAECANTDGSYNCTCNWGYFEPENPDDHGGETCLDSNECGDLEGGTQVPGDFEWGSNNCDINAECANTDGNYTCTCAEGFTGTGFDGECEDLDECAVMEICHADDSCRDEVAAHSNMLEPSALPEPIDGFTFNIISCDMTFGSCNNTAADEGGYICNCNEGYNSTDGLNHFCEDIDECSTGELNECDVNANCTNTPGDYECACLDGFEGDGYDGNCTDIDECLTGAHDCAEVGGNCTNVIGSWECECLDGFEDTSPDTVDFPGRNCTDVDECSIPLGNTTLISGTNYTNECSENADCTNNDGSYDCVCLDGYRDEFNFTHPDENEDDLEPGWICEEIDECSEGTHECAGVNSFGLDTAYCDNTAGGYTCTCFAEYYGDGFICIDSDECGDLSDEAQTVTGIEPEGVEYTDVNFMSNDCDAVATCANTDGDYNCTCADGYEDIGEGRTGECEDINECDIPICDPAKSTCDNLPGTFECECFDGYVDVSELQDGTNCTNVNECEDGTHTCHANSTCTDTTGGYECACIEGYEDEPSQSGNASYVIGTECVDIDECGDADLNNCHETLGICDNTPGNYTCECIDGYEGNGGFCNNINECWAETHDCHEFADCTDGEPGFDCACQAGFDDTSAADGLDVGRNCSDIDECADPALNDCGTDNAECINIDGGFNCTCSDGYEGDGKICENIDECTSVDFPHDCHDNATCTDNDGSFDCACKNGFNDVDGDGRNCTDIDECADIALNNCDPDPAEGTCVNTDQGYECGCQDGFLFQEDKPSKCLDINECFEGGHNCVEDLDGGICSNSLGTFSCECAEGWAGDGTTDGDGCVDDDECDLGTHTCDDNAECGNIGGSFECECNDGWSGDGFTCEDVDECVSIDLNSCDPLATCVNNDGSYECECPDGYSLNQFTNQCNDVDECANNASNCDLDNDATCQNTEGSFTCVCPTGLGGAGTFEDPCTEVLGKCDPFAVEGYVIQGTCKKKENSVCVATCDGDATPPFFLAADGETDVTINFKCACEGDRSGDGSNLICNYVLVNSEEKVKLCQRLKTEVLIF